MNLDEFNDLWGEYTDDETKKYQVEASEINDMIKTRAGNILSLIRRNLRIDLAILLLTIILGIVLVLVYQNIIVTLLVGAIIILFIPFVVMMIRQIIACKPELIEQHNLKQWISQIIKSIEHYLNRYTKGAVFATILSIPIGAGLGYYFGNEHTDVLDYLVGIAQNNKTAWLGVSILIMGILLLLNYFITKWYLGKMYGKYLVALKDCHSELEDI